MKLSCNMRPQSQRQLCNICTWLPEREVARQREGGSGGLYLSSTEAILFTYVKDTIWSTVNLQRPAEPHLAALQTPNSQSGVGSHRLEGKRQGL